MKIKQFIFALFICLLCFLPNVLIAELQIIVPPSNHWGNMSSKDIETLCENIVSHFEKHLRPEHEMNDTVNVHRDFNLSHVTIGADGNHKIGINLDMSIAPDAFYYFIWSFSHEICHILHDYEVTTINNPNLWFQESICMMASIWALKSMADTWKQDSPFGQEHLFSINFDHYANALLNDPSSEYDGTAEEWIEEYETFLREDYYRTQSFTQHHYLVAGLSYKFLHIFEENPEAWNAVRKMPATKGELSEYMQDWYDNVAQPDKKYVEDIAEVMGISITPVTATVIVINADVNKDGYVDLYDVLIVRSAMQNSVAYDTDINNDGRTDEIDLLIVKAKAFEAIAAAAPHKRKTQITTWGSLKRR